jgi:hypothetical protein
MHLSGLSSKITSQMDGWIEGGRVYNYNQSQHSPYWVNFSDLVLICFSATVLLIYHGVYMFEKKLIT